MEKRKSIRVSNRAERGFYHQIELHESSSWKGEREKRRSGLGARLGICLSRSPPPTARSSSRASASSGPAGTPREA